MNLATLIPYQSAQNAWLNVKVGNSMLIILMVMDFQMELLDGLIGEMKTGPVDIFGSNLRNMT